MTHWLVLPSPFLGSTSYAPLADALRTDGDDASVAYDDPPVAAELVAGWSEAARALRDVVLVPHSNAGHLAPLVSARSGDVPIVFMDAALPAPSGSSPLMPAALRAHLADLAEPDGRLPRWTRWWPRADLAFGETYAEELGRARELGWPHRIVAGRHLQCVIAPEETAASLRGLGVTQRSTG